MPKNEVYEAALGYIQEGFKVLPLKPKGKIPITAHGLKDATQTQLGVKEYWGKCPEANIALVCDGLIVIDFDADKNGLESKSALIDKYGQLPRTRVFKTGGGGEHWLYRVSIDLNIRPGAGNYGYPGVDIRANASYIVVPPSIHPNGNRYEVIDGSPLADAPSWLIDFATIKQTSYTRTEAPGIAAIYAEGQRNSALASLAGGMRWRGMAQTAIEAALLESNRTQCQPPLADDEVRRIASSIGKYPPAPIVSKPSNNGNKEAKIESLPVRCVANVEAVEIRWLWYPYIPFGKVTLIEGDPGEGKSHLALAIATGVSLGNGIPGQCELALGEVLIASAEDGIADTIRPRLDRMGARIDRIHASDNLFDLDEIGFQRLESTIFEIMPVLIIIDPLVAYLSGNVDIHKANQVRYAMARLEHLAGSYGAAIIAIRHLTKGSTLKPIYRGLGSIDFTASARSVILAGSDPDDEMKKGFVHIKSNLAPKGKAIGYRLDGEGFFWTEICELTAGKILAPSADESLRDTAKNFLLDALEIGEQPTKDVYSEADRQGISKATLRLAMQDLKVDCFNIAEMGKRGAGRWYMRLPDGKGG